MKPRSYLQKVIFLNPLVILVYAVLAYNLATLMKAGGLAQKLPIILICTLILIGWFAWSFYRFRNQRTEPTAKIQPINKWWYYLSLSPFLLITLVAGVSIYQSGTQLRGKLAWVIHDLRTEREIPYEPGNLYTDGFQELLATVNEQVPLPEHLYTSTGISIRIQKDGTITGFYGFLYGKNTKKETKTFLINYDRSTNGQIVVTIGEDYGQYTYSVDEVLQPLLIAVESIPFEAAVDSWNEEEFEITYSGMRNWGFNRDDIIYFDESGTLGMPEVSEEEIEGYTLSLYPVSEATPVIRYVYLTSLVPIDDYLPPVQEDPIAEGEDSFFLTDKIGYHLEVADAAMGSRFYVLNKTLNRGNNWLRHNPDPFLGSTGVSSGITFINEDLGFIGLSHNGGSDAELYRTEDGGATFEMVALPSIERPLSDTETYEPFDFPEMPYEEDGKLLLLVNQGENGDYHGGSKALLESIDDGLNWKYVEEVRQSNE